MPFLTFKNASVQHVGLLTHRLWSAGDFRTGWCLSDPTVSRLHAWLDPTTDGTGWVVTDAGSKTGTFLNGRQVYRQELADGDVFRVGATRITYHTGDTLPADADQVDLSAPNGVIKTSGILFNCPNCSAPLWVANDLAGKRGLCRHCKKNVTVPDSAPVVERVSPAPPPVKAPPAAPAATASGQRTAPRPPAKKLLERCAVCHSDIQTDEAMTTCVECAMHFHTECWQENYGCSSYGCGQVDVLNPNPTAPEVVEKPTRTRPTVTGDLLPPEETEPESNTPWEMIVLAASVIASVLGAVAFGIPAAVVAAWSIILMARGRKKTLLIVALVICVLGIAGGLIFSDLRYFDARHLPFKI